MSDGAMLNGETQAASAGSVAATGGAATAAAAAASTSAQGAPAAAAAFAPAAQPAPVAAPATSVAAAVPAAAAAVAQPAPAHANHSADCKPKKKAAAKDDKREDQDEQGKVPDEENQDLSQPVDTCVFPVTGEASAPAQQAAPAASGGGEVIEDVGGGGGGISSGLLIGAGVLAAAGLGAVLLRGGGDDNDPPTAVADTGAVNEGQSLTGSVATNDSDPDGDTLTYSFTGTAPAGFTSQANGSFTFDANNAAYNSLAAGQTQVLTIPYTVTDSEGNSANSTLTITVTGTNDVPVATAATATATEGATTLVTGTLVATDPDQGQTATLVFSLPTAVAGLTVNPNGTFSFNPNDPAYNSLAAGQTQQVVANVRVTDASGGIANTTLTITVTGTNDAPVAANITRSGNEDTQITGNLSGSDPDTGAVLTYSVVGTPPAGFTFDRTTGAFTLDTTNAAYQTLTQGQTQNVVVNYTVSDGTATSAPATLTITVTGQAEALALTDTDNNPATRDIFTLLNTDFVITDDQTVANNSEIRNFGADDVIVFNAPFSGTGAVSFTNIDFNGDGLANDLRITTNNNGVVSDTILVNVITDPNAAVFSEETAEAAVAGTDNFRTTTQSATPTAVSLDVDNDGSTTSRFTVSTVANTGTFNFTDDANFANNVLVRDFGADDRLTFNTAQSNVSFFSGDLDGDGVADDVRITVNNGGTVSDIVLTNAVAANTAVTSFATAEAAIGNGVQNFFFNGTVIAPPAPPPAGTTVANLDIDNDSNLETYRVFDASTDGFRFTDDANVPNSVEIINFGTNDRIVLEAGNTYSFTNVARDADGLANDLRITINNLSNGGVSDIFIKDVVDPNAFVFNETTAEQALNARFGSGSVDYFSFA